MTRLIILTSAELRHAFFRKALALAAEIEVLASYCEGLAGSLVDRVAQTSALDSLEQRHLEARHRSEEDFFGAFVHLTPDHSNPVSLPRKAINYPEHIDCIRALDPDLIICYGSSIIREPLLSLFQGRFVNVHLGLSPYYRGSGTNFWPLVNGEPEFCGVTFMHIDAGIDTGEIVHQIRARIFPGDTPHQIGNRLIVDMTEASIALVKRFRSLLPVPQPERPETCRYYKKADFNAAAVAACYERFEQGMVETYLVEAEKRKASAPILQNAALLA